MDVCPGALHLIWVPVWCAVFDEVRPLAGSVRDASKDMPDLSSGDDGIIGDAQEGTHLIGNGSDYAEAGTSLRGRLKTENDLADAVDYTAVGK